MWFMHYTSSNQNAATPQSYIEDGDYSGDKRRW